MFLKNVHQSLNLESKALLMFSSEKCEQNIILLISTPVLLCSSIQRYKSYGQTQRFKGHLCSWD